jgi:hypothetical protein
MKKLNRLIGYILIGILPASIVIWFIWGFYLLFTTASRENLIIILASIVIFISFPAGLCIIVINDNDD